MKLITAFVATVCLALFSTAAVAKCDGDPEKEIEILALNMYHEARGEGRTGMQMVGEVVLNRIKSGAYPDTICEVVYQRGQFSWIKKKNHTPREKESWDIALEIAEKLVHDELYMYDNGATHFLNTHDLKRVPSWAKRYKVVAKIGSHTFYKKS